MIYGPPGDACIQFADPGRVQGVVQERLGDVQRVTAHQEEWDAEPLETRETGASGFSVFKSFWSKF